MYEPRNYDWETQRINAFLIMNNKIYEAKEHIKCFEKALGIDLNEWWSIDEIEEYKNIKINRDYILGEVANIDGKRSIICVGEIKKDRDIICKYYKDISYDNYYN